MRNLLPAERELCEFVGISESEYWEFLRLQDEYDGKRPEGYELIPDVRNEPATIALVVAQLVIGIAMVALAPKPKAPGARKEPPKLQTENITGRQSFAPTNNFNSAQELATVGETIPLVYARRGIRVNAKLLWSQLKSLGRMQQLKAIFLFSHGKLGARPDFAGFAIGDTLLENYTAAKIQLLFKRNGGRLTNGDAYSEGTLKKTKQDDVFLIPDDAEDGKKRPNFSGVRNPSTQTQFGAFGAMPNGNAFKVDYELIIIGKDLSKEPKEDLRVKKRKIKAQYPFGASIVSGDSNECTYRISKVGVRVREGDKVSQEKFKPWGVSDVESAINSRRIDADEALTPGEIYLIGDAIGVLQNYDSDPWRPGAVTKDAKFKIIEGKRADYDVNQTNEGKPGYDTHLIQRCAIGVVTNNRSCHQTELGIKSTVWGRMNGTPNLNSVPDGDTIAKYEKENGTIGIGSISKYLARYSAFELQIRELGKGAGWQNLTQGKLFVVRGQTPQAQYNWIRVAHGFGQYEFRFKPVSGKTLKREYVDKSKNVFLFQPGESTSFTVKSFTVTFGGLKQKLTVGDVSNPEWILGDPDVSGAGQVVGFSKAKKGSIPTATHWENAGTKYDKGEDYVALKQGIYSFYADDEFIGSSSDDEIVDGNKKYAVGTQQEVSGEKATYTRYYSIREYRKEVKQTTGKKYNNRAVNGGSGNGLTVDVFTWKNDSVGEWEIENAGSGYKNGDTVTIPVLNVQVKLKVNNKKFKEKNLNPYDAIEDINQYGSYSSSHQDGPEHSVVYLNEQVDQGKPVYDDLAIAGLRLNSSTEWQDFSNLSAFIKMGIEVNRLINNNGKNVDDGDLVESTNLFPEVAYDLLTNDERGAGELVGKTQVDRSRMQIAAKFCKAMNFKWDGVITDKQNIRDWMYEIAQYHLLDFTIIGGRFSLFPTVPYDSDFKVKKDKKPNYKALFTDGNIKDLKVSFLSPEERQLFRAVVLWRQDEENGFARTRSLTVRFADKEDTDAEETFDMSGFCTSKDHAQFFARYALMVRRYVDHNITFKTTPQAGMGLEPGQYFRLVSHSTHTNRFDNGSIGPDGKIQASTPVDNNTKIIYWKPGKNGLDEETLEVENGKTKQKKLFGTVFTVKVNAATSRAYKCASLSYGEDGLVEVSAVHVPLNDQGEIRYLQWNNSTFDQEAG